MRCNSDKVILGIMNYADAEIIGKLPTMGKWLAGTAIGMVSSKVNDVVMNIQNNSALKMVGAIDDDGMIDVDLIMDNMKQSADRYGNAHISIPLVGDMSFSSSDIDTLRSYIMRA